MKDLIRRVAPQSYRTAVRVKVLTELFLRAWRMDADQDALSLVIDQGPPHTDKTCPLCDYVGPFRVFGSPPRWAALCPQCGTYERHRLLFLYLKGSPIPASAKIIHFAPEPKLAEIFRRSHANYRTSHFPSGDADLHLNVEDIDLAASSVDVVICNHVLEHVDDRKALAEIRRVLAPGGRLLAMVPIIEGWDRTYEDPGISADQDRTIHFGQFDHVRLYGADFRDRIRDAGFSLNEFTAFGAEAVRHGLLAGEKVFVCIKRD